MPHVRVSGSESVCVHSTCEDSKTFAYGPCTCHGHCGVICETAILDDICLNIFLVQPLKLCVNCAVFCSDMFIRSLMLKLWTKKITVEISKALIHC